MKIVSRCSERWSITLCRTVNVWILMHKTFFIHLDWIAVNYYGYGSRAEVKKQFLSADIQHVMLIIFGSNTTAL